MIGVFIASDPNALHIKVKIGSFDSAHKSISSKKAAKINKQTTNGGILLLAPLDCLPQTNIDHVAENAANSLHTRPLSNFIAALIAFSLINIIALSYFTSPKDPKAIDLSCTEKQLNAVGKVTSWWLAKAYFAESQPPEIVVLGTSQVGSLLNADAYVYDRRVDITGDHRSYTIEHDLKLLLHKDWRTLVLGFPGAMISDQLIMSHALFSKKHHPKLVVLTISPRDFIDNMYHSPTSSEVFAFFSKSINFEPEMQSIFTPQFKSLIDIHSFIPLRTVGRDILCLEDYNVSSRNNDCMIPAPARSIAMPFERVIPRQCEIGSGDLYFYRDNTQDYRRRYKCPYSQQLNLQLSCLDLLFKYLAEQGISVSVVEMPLTNYNHILLPETFWSFYKTKIKETCRKYEVDYWDTESIWDDFSSLEFCDSVHLNLHGGLKVTRPVVLATAYKFHLPMYTFNGNFGPLVPGKEKTYFHKSWSNDQNN